MQAYVETTTPLGANPTPAWALWIARPATDGHRMAEALRGVPKPTLQTIFGEFLGRRLWDQTRSRAGAGTAGGVLDSEISAGMVAYASQRAADALQSARQQAKSLTLAITYTDGEIKLTRTRLAQSTNAAAQIAEAATRLLRQVAIPAAPIASIRLGMTTVQAAAVRETASELLAATSNGKSLTAASETRARKASRTKGLAATTR
jgi:hypothetical protein